MRKSVTQLTLPILVVHPRYPPVRQHLYVEADAHVAIEATQPLDAQEIVTVSADLLPLLHRHVQQGPGEECLEALLRSVQPGDASRQPGHQHQDHDVPQGRLL